MIEKKENVFFFTQACYNKYTIKNQIEKDQQKDNPKDVTHQVNQILEIITKLTNGNYSIEDSNFYFPFLTNLRMN